MTHTIESLLACTRAHVREVMGPKFDTEGLGLDHTFTEIGIDSLCLTEISNSVLSELDLYVPMARLARAPTVREFLQVVLDGLEAAQD